MSESIERHFVGRHGNLLDAAADWLCERYAQGDLLDLSGLAIVTQGGRTGRRLLEILIDRATTDALLLIPPRTMTVGGLGETLSGRTGRMVGATARRLAWRSVVREAELETMQRFLGKRAAIESDEQSMEETARLLEAYTDELISEAQSFSVVAAMMHEQGRDDEAARWQAAESLHTAYLARLAEWGVEDRAWARLTALREGTCRAEMTIVLVGVVEMSGCLRGMVAQLTSEVHALIHADAEEAVGYDALGLAVTEYWQEAAIEIDDRIIRLADTAVDQAEAVVDVLADLPSETSVESISVGIPDPQVLPYLEQRLELTGLPTHEATGRTLRLAAPARLLKGIADFLDQQAMSDFVALVRHPDLDAWLRSTGQIDEAGVTDWLNLLDDYYNETLALRATGDWLGNPERRHALACVWQIVNDQLLASLTAQAAPFTQWAEQIGDLLRAIYGDLPGRGGTLAQQKSAAACLAIWQELATWSDLPGDAGKQTISGPAALRLLLSLVESSHVGVDPSGPAIELIGWLELAHDDAPHLIVTGMNDGIVPTTVTADPLLPDGIRRELGLMSNARRTARDACLLRSIVARHRSVTLIVGRRGATGDPLRPSRLLFRSPEKTVVDRVDRLFDPARAWRGPVLPAGIEPGSSSAFQPKLPLPDPAAIPVLTSMRVTAFRDYLASPYGFFLQHVLRLSPITESIREMDPLAFGTLAHDVLAAFGRSEVKQEHAPDAIFHWLDETMSRELDRRYGDEPRAAVRVQVAQLRERLRRFAHWQADHAQQGWIIEQVEWDISKSGGSLLVDGQPMGLRGRIDRIDRHPESGRRIVFDYKTSESALPPDKTHRVGPQAEKRWIDLQLPLYDHLVRQLLGADQVQLGYILLPGSLDQVGHSLADWTADDLATAIETAADVVRAVRERAYEEPGDRPPSEKVLRAIMGADLSHLLESDDDPDDEAGGNS